MSIWLTSQLWHWIKHENTLDLNKPLWDHKQFHNWDFLFLFWLGRVHPLCLGHLRHGDSSCVIPSAAAFHWGYSTLCHRWFPGWRELKGILCELVRTTVQVAGWLQLWGNKYEWCARLCPGPRHIAVFTESHSDSRRPGPESRRRLPRLSRLFSCRGVTEAAPTLSTLAIHRSPGAEVSRASHPPLTKHKGSTSPSSWIKLLYWQGLSPFKRLISAIKKFLVLWLNLL